MEMSGEELIEVPQQRVWEALNDPDILRRCITGCDTVERISGEEFKVVLTAAIGPVKAKFSGKLLLRDVVPPESYTLSFEGSGGVAGFGKGSAHVRLSPEGASTRLSYEAKAQVGGKLAQVGSRLIDGVSRKMAEEFFAKFKATVSEPGPAAQAEPTAGDAVAASVQSPLPTPAAAIPAWIWVVIALAALALGFFFRR